MTLRCNHSVTIAHSGIRLFGRDEGMVGGRRIQPDHYRPTYQLSYSYPRRAQP